MIIVKLWGGMCNQLFQYAFGYALARKYNETLVFDVEFYKNQPKHVGKRSIITPDQFPNIGNLATIGRSQPIRIIENKYISHILRHSTGCRFSINNLHVFMEKLYRFYPDIPYKSCMTNYYSGYWQSAKYFEHYRDDLLNLFQPNTEIQNKANSWRQSIDSPCCVAIHVRRGDFLWGKNNSTCDLYYYKDAIALLHQMQPNPTLCFFSDDIDWCKNAFQEYSNSIFVENGGEYSDLLDLYSISLCEHGIMSLSTFSWWGNWLRKNNSHSIVICPNKDKMYDSFIPDNWIKYPALKKSIL